MDKIGIIAGSGSLPIIIGKSLISKNYKICFFCLKNFANLDSYKDYEHLEIDIVSFSSILKALNNQKIDKIIMAGKITRPSIRDIKFDIKTLSLIKDFVLESKGDDKLLRTISNFFKKNGFPLFDWKHVCTEIFASIDHLTVNRPSNLAKKNLKKGLEVFKLIGQADIGQSIIIQNQLILGIECIEGTDELIQRSAAYKRKDDKGIMLKLTKYDQHESLDVPTIGLETVKNLKENLYEGLYLEKNKCIILDKEKVIIFCNQNNIFLSTTSKIDK